MRRTFLILTLTLTILLAGLIVYGEFSPASPRRFSAKLSTAVHSSIDGWRVRDLPLAATEGSLEQVNKILQFDDSVQRVYERNDLQVIVYAAYWTPGKVTIADAGVHNPDSCWVNAGMTRTERLYSQNDNIAGRPLLPFEYGAYAQNGHTQYVMFWHLVQGVPQNYAEQKEGWRNGLVGRIERLPLALADMKKYGLNQKREQLFIRISANKPLVDIKYDPAFDALLTSVAQLGIFKDSSWADKPDTGAPKN